MRCLKCGYENDENNKFCIKCGSAITVENTKIPPTPQKRNRPIILISIIILLVCLLIGGTVLITISVMNKQQDSTKLDKTDEVKEIETTVTNDIYEKESNKVDQIVEEIDWKRIYLDYIIDQMNNDIYKVEDGCLVYIDDDEIPELYLCGSCMVEGSELCYIDGKEVKSLGIHLYGLDYIEKANWFKVSFAHQGNYSDAIYSIKNGEFIRHHYGEYELASGSDYIYRDKYIWNGVETQREDYINKLNDVFDSSQICEDTRSRIPVDELVAYLSDGSIEATVDQIQKPFYGIWCPSTKICIVARDCAETLKTYGFDTYVVNTDDWSNLNDGWYAVTAGLYESEAEAQQMLGRVLEVYEEAYIKYSGNYLGDNTAEFVSDESYVVCISEMRNDGSLTFRYSDTSTEALEPFEDINTLNYSSDVKISILDPTKEYGPNTENVLTEKETFINMVSDAYQFNGYGFTCLITVQNGVIVEIEEFYLP